jgi:acetyl esterase/lipase
MFIRYTRIFKTADGCSIAADVYRPPDEVIRPAILWLHGGALIFGAREALPADQMERYVRAGYVVVSADYRLAPETRLPAIIEDLRDAYRWLRERGPELFRAHPDRIAVIGHSAGGYLTLMSGFCMAPRPRALVAFYGYGDIVGDWYTRPSAHYNQQPAVPEEEAYGVVGGPPLANSPTGERFRYYLYCRQRGTWPQEVSGRHPAAEPDWFIPYCPLRQVTPDYPPTLLLHGDQDTDVPYQQSVLMAEALRQQGVTHELLTMAGRGHGFDHQGEGVADPLVAKAFDRVLAYLHQHLSP